MHLHDIKQIPIVAYLAQAGFEAKLIKGVNYWYCSPLRSELTPSFKVNAERNQWYDFGTGDHGDIIDLVCALQHCSTAEAMRSLSGLKETQPAESFSFGGITPLRSQAPTMELISVQAVKHPKLLLYLWERGLQPSDASPFLYEVYYKVSGKCFFVLGFPNDAGGWELRNPYFKGSFAPKAIRTIKGTDSHKSYSSSRASWTFSLGGNFTPRCKQIASCLIRSPCSQNSFSRFVPTLRSRAFLIMMKLGIGQRNNSSTLGYPSRICERATLPIKT